MKCVYICAPLGGNTEESLKKVRRYAEYALRCGTAPVVPHFYAECLDDAKPAEREMGMSAGLALLWFCDEMWVFGPVITKEMEREIEFCANLGMKVRYITEKEVTKKIGEKKS